MQPSGGCFRFVSFILPALPSQSPDSEADVWNGEGNRNGRKGERLQPSATSMAHTTNHDIIPPPTPFLFAFFYRLTGHLTSLQYQLKTLVNITYRGQTKCLPDNHPVSSSSCESGHLRSQEARFCRAILVFSTTDSSKPRRFLLITSHHF